MRSDELDRALGPTPQSFADRMDQTLLHLEEEKPVKRIAFGTVLIAAVLALALGTTAYAVVSQGLEWYYNNRFTAYQQYEPEKHSAIMVHLQTEVSQKPVDDPDINIAVTEASWAPEQNVLVVSLEATAADPEKNELHPMWNLDADGSYVGPENLAAYADDEEARAVHWLWTEDGMGPVAEMVAPGKQLLLLRTSEVYLDDIHLMGDMSSADEYVSEDGAVHTVLEIRMDDYFDPNFGARVQEQIKASPELADHWNRRLKDVERFRQIISEDEDGVVTLRVPYTVTYYTDDDAQLYTGGRQGEVQFEMKFR